MPLQGQCLCGQTKVNIQDGSLPLQSMACHCYNCRATAGSAYSIVFQVNLSDIDVSGEPGSYKDTNTKSGNTMLRYFCKSCGTPIETRPAGDDAKITFIKSGLFAGRTEVPKPVAELFCANKESWEQPIEGSQQAQHMPE